MSMQYISSIERVVESFEDVIQCTFVQTDGAVFIGSSLIMRDKAIKVVFGSTFLGFENTVFVKYPGVPGTDNTTNSIMSEILNKLVTGTFCMFGIEKSFLKMEGLELYENNTDVLERVLEVKEMVKHKL